MKQAKHYKIEKNVPMPKGRGLGGRYADLFKKMVVGDSINLGRDKKECQSIVSAAYGFGKNNKQSFAFRKMENGTLRLWRVK